MDLWLNSAEAWLDCLFRLVKSQRHETWVPFFASLSIQMDGLSCIKKTRSAAKLLTRAPSGDFLDRRGSTFRVLLLMEVLSKQLCLNRIHSPINEVALAKVESENIRILQEACSTFLSVRFGDLGPSSCQP